MERGRNAEWQESILGRGDSMCKIPETGEPTTCLRNQMKTSVAGTWKIRGRRESWRNRQGAYEHSVTSLTECRHQSHYEPVSTCPVGGGKHSILRGGGHWESGGEHDLCFVFSSGHLSC